MAKPLKFFRVKELPHPSEPGAVYYVKPDGANGVREFVTDEYGNAFPVAIDADIGNVDLGTFN